MQGPPTWTPKGPWLRTLIGDRAAASINPRTPRSLSKVLNRWRIEDPAELPATIPALVYTAPVDAPLSSWIERVRPGGWIVEITWPSRRALARLGLARPIVRVAEAERRVRFALASGSADLQQWPAPEAANPHLVTLWRASP